ncbi:MAG: hypothetical protein COV45_05445 [Deltaproteobacteria bacterium CG11_big_fil_rev_8_21_14_0_20_47_16]|nr:MAG: hypothetical protein COV45_05445 [Deltaproteobacteria bacterium CG11_big_fil_rev_8_21_14_0_20_47_16]
MAHYHQVWHPKSHDVETEITHWTHNVWRWVRSHLPHLKMVGIAVTLFLVLYGIMKGYTNFRESAATQLFVQSATNDSIPPRSVLETVAQKYPRTAAGKYADWLLATQYYHDNSFAEAATTYQRLAERNSVHHLYHLIAAEGEAYSQEQQKDYASAAQVFSKLARIDGNPFSNQDILNAARNEWLAGHKDAAEALLKTSQSPQAATIKLALEVGLLP